jgi:DNA-directed RNA polymerase subunit RPC12/RpoP
MSNLKRRHNRGDGPAIVECEACGHKGTTRSRGFPALGMEELAGKTVRCSHCGHRQVFEAEFARQLAMLKALEQEPPTASVN